MRKALLCALIALALLGCAAKKPLEPRSATFGPLKFTPPPISEKVLSGGAKVFLLEDHEIPLVRVFFSFRGGAVYDPPDLAGISSVTAMAWRSGGTLAHPAGELDDLLEDRAIDLGLSIGRQSGTVTLSALKEDLEAGLGFARELIFTPAFDEGRWKVAVKRAKSDILREEEDVEALAFREFRRAMYRGTPRGVTPTLKTVDAMKREDSIGYRERLVSDSGWVVGVAGDFDPARIMALLEENFGKLPGEGGSFQPLLPPPTPEPQIVV
ncbi:insulinase family protein, partial [bacterium]